MLEDETKEYPEIKGYTILKKLGSSSFGDLYLADQDLLNRMVCIKVFPHEATSDSDSKKKFIEYASAHAALTHQYLVNTNACGEIEGGRMYAIFAYIACKNLRQCMDEGLIDGTNILPVIINLTDILHSSQDKSFYKHIIKPENILINDEGCAILSDFGASGFLSLDDQIKFQGISSYKYYAPELLEGQNQNERSVIYSLAVIIYEALTGKLPKGVIDPLIKGNCISPKLNEIIIKNLSQDSSKRTSTVEEFGDILYSIETGDDQDEISGEEFHTSPSGAYSTEKLKSDEVPDSTPPSLQLVTPNIIGSKSIQKRKKKIPPQGEKSNLVSSKKYARSWPMILMLLITMCFLAGGVYYINNYGLASKPAVTASTGIEAVKTKPGALVAISVRPRIELGVVDDRSDPVLVQIRLTNALEIVKDLSSLKQSPTNSPQTPVVNVEFSDLANHVYSVSFTNKISDLKSSYVLRLNKGAVDTPSALKITIKLADGGALESDYLDMKNLIPKLFEEVDPSKVSKIPPPDLNPGVTQGIFPESDSTLSEPSASTQKYRVSDASESQSPTSLDLSPAPVPSARDLVIKKGWINSKEDRALILLSFGSNRPVGNLDENEGLRHAVRVSESYSYRMYKPITFQCAYSINKQWDTLKSFSDKANENKLTQHTDIAAGGFSSKWMGISPTQIWSGDKAYKMKHVFQVDLTDPAIKENANFLLVKINPTYSSEESNYKNNVIALPLNSKGSWTEIINSEAEISEDVGSVTAPDPLANFHELSQSPEIKASVDILLEDFKTHFSGKNKKYTSNKSYEKFIWSSVVGSCGKSQSDAMLVEIMNYLMLQLKETEDYPDKATYKRMSQIEGKER